MVPATTETMKLAAPMSSPMARLPESERRAAKVEKTSGLPLEKARKVTPACDERGAGRRAEESQQGVSPSIMLIVRGMLEEEGRRGGGGGGGGERGGRTTLSLSPRRLAMWLRFGQKNSDAQMPTKANRNVSQRTMTANKAALGPPGAACSQRASQSMRAPPSSPGGGSFGLRLAWRRARWARRWGRLEAASERSGVAARQHTRCRTPTTAMARYS